MWVVFGNRANVKPISGGLEVSRHCDECERVTKWQECDVKDRVHVFFVDLFSMTQRRMVCTECGEDADMDEAQRQVRVATAPASRRPGTAPPASSRQPASPERAKKRGNDDDIEAELAALKKRLKG